MSKYMAPDASRIAVEEFDCKSGAPLRLITLQRADKLNCLSLAMLEELLLHLRSSDTRSVLVLMGAGRSFCAGIDLDEIGGTEAASPERARVHLQRLADVYRWFLTTKVPTIVLARGHAVGGGAGLVASARTVVVADDFRFRLPGANLVRLAAVALPMIGLRTGKSSGGELLGREFDSRAALRQGLVDGVVTSRRLAELGSALRSGVLPPELPPPISRPVPSVERARIELDQFVREIAASG